MEPLSLLCHICRLACLPLICLSWLSGEWPRFLAEMTASGSTFSEILLLETTLWLCVRISNFYVGQSMVCTISVNAFLTCEPSVRVSRHIEQLRR